MTTPPRRRGTVSGLGGLGLARPRWREKWTPRVLVSVALYFNVCALAIVNLPDTLWDARLDRATLVIGALGAWRYSWWLTHLIRALIYAKRAFPPLRRRADVIWHRGWRPPHLHFLLTTFKERTETTEMVVLGICQEIRACGVPATIWLGSANAPDERAIETALRRFAGDLEIRLRVVRQNAPGKRVAIGLILRAMSRAGLESEALVVFMDGDFVLAPGALPKCLPLFAVHRDLQAVTTDEDVLCIGPAWMRIWLSMRFAQRRIAMQSHALSGRVLTLTGRMSVFRSEHLTKIDFIRLLEADSLNHWLWGRFRFLSGDDKSTWYYLLRQGARMLYVPDASGHTIEVVEGSGWRRMVENFRRWSGNMLRNGARAIALGPRRMPFFIWWCLIDQRLAIWTMLASPLLAVATSIQNGAEYFLAYAIFIAVSRMLLSLVLFVFSPRIYLSYPFFLYANQVMLAFVKIHMLTRLAKQKWANRGDQRQSLRGAGTLSWFRTGMASYALCLYLSLLVLCVLQGGGFVDSPSLLSVTIFFHRLFD